MFRLHLKHGEARGDVQPFKLMLAPSACHQHRQVGHSVALPRCQRAADRRLYHGVEALFQHLHARPMPANISNMTHPAPYCTFTATPVTSIMARA